jgi:hypothetical protein
MPPSEKFRKVEPSPDKGLLMTILGKRPEMPSSRKPECYNYAAMSKYTISRNDDEPIGMHTTDLDAQDVLDFLESVDAYLYSVGEYDEEEEQVERLNGDEWLNKYTTHARVLK